MGRTESNNFDKMTRGRLKMKKEKVGLLDVMMIIRES